MPLPAYRTDRGSPDLYPIPGRDGWWRLDRAYVVHGPQGMLIVPAEFETDGTSVPRLLWLAVGHPFDSRLIYGAVIHDAAYHDALLFDGSPIRLTQLEADMLYYDIMQEGITIEGILVRPRWWKRKAVYRALRMFGWLNFKGEKR